jgi:hypothetical protein
MVAKAKLREAAAMIRAAKEQAQRDGLMTSNMQMQQMMQKQQQPGGVVPRGGYLGGGAVHVDSAVL